MMHGHEKSDPAKVAGKPANKANEPTAEASARANAAEPEEPRAGAKGNAGQQSTCRAQSRVSVSQALERIREVARERKKERFTALFHHISIELLEQSFFELKEDAAPGVYRLLLVMRREALGLTVPADAAQPHEARAHSICR
jgi:RNA-directed DNA polymerase